MFYFNYNKISDLKMLFTKGFLNPKIIFTSKILYFKNNFYFKNKKDLFDK